MGFSRRDSQAQRLIVHIGEHQHRAVARIDHDRRNETLFVEDGRKCAALFGFLRHQSEKPPDGERTSSMNRAWRTGLDLNSPVNWVVMVATLRLLTPLSDMH